MNKSTIINKISTSFKRSRFAVEKHSPEILIVSGIAGTITATVLACKATTKLNTILDESKESLSAIKKAAVNPELADRYSLEDSKKDIAIIYVQTGAKLIKLYAPAFMIGVLSITSILASNNILKKRNVALAAAYATIDTSFKEYRNRVVERFGEEVENEIKYNLKSEKIEETVVDENGKEKKVKKTVSVSSMDGENGYARYFEKGCGGWERDRSYNMAFLSAQQHFANDKLRADGRLFLNEVYTMLGIPWSKAGQIVGWKYDPTSDVGDNFVDFGIREVYKEVAINGEKKHEPTILLDFNVDGNIWDLM